MGQKKFKKLKIFEMKKNTGKLNARGNICAWREPVIAKQISTIKQKPNLHQENGKDALRAIPYSAKLPICKRKRPKELTKFAANVL